MSKKRSAGFDAQYDRKHFAERVSLPGLHWEDAVIIVDIYDEEIEAGQPELMTDREHLGDACLWLLIDADGFSIRQRREFVERLIGPTWPIDLVACRAEVVEFRTWATARIIENEQREAFRKRVDMSDPNPDVEPLF